MNGELPHLTLGALHGTLDEAFPQRIRTPWGEILAILRLDATQQIANQHKACCFKLSHYAKILMTGASNL